MCLQEELRTQTYRHGAYTHFTIHEPKRRRISASPFRDRVIHHALCRVIEPHFERRFIADSYANRLGKGTHRAVDRLQQFSRQYPYVLRVDIVKHFPSIDHEILLTILETQIRDEGLRWLLREIVASGDGVLRDEYQPRYFAGDDLFAINRPRGLPIGNLTSQFWSNCYLDILDQFVKRRLRCKAYIRYVDDFALFSQDKRQLWAWKQAVIEHLAGLRLSIHDTAAQVTPVEHGIPWLGWVVYPTHRRLKARNAVKFRRRLEKNIDYYQLGRISFAELDASVQGWINHVCYGDTWGLRQHIFDTHPIKTPK